MPTYSAMYAYGGAADVAEDEELFGQDDEWREATPEERMASSRSRSTPGSGSDMLGRGKGRGGDASTSGVRENRDDENWERESYGGAQHFHMGSESAGSGSRDEWDSGSSSTWWSCGYNENWSWGDRRDWKSSRGGGNWEWVETPDPWADWYHSQRREKKDEDHDHRSCDWHGEHGGHSREQGRHSGDCQGNGRRNREGEGDGRRVRGESPASPVAARDVSGSLPSGERGSAGEQKEPAAAGERRGKLSSSYPPIFRAKPGESYKEWRRSVDFWLGA